MAYRSEPPRFGLKGRKAMNALDYRRALWLSILLLTMGVGVRHGVAQQPTQLPTDWSAIRGVNYIPSYARGSREIWEKYDHAVVDRELGYAAGLGLNSIRVFLHFRAYRHNPEKFLASVGDFLKLCARHRLTVLPILFDSCGTDARPDAVDMTSEAAYRKFLADPSLPQEAKKRMEQVYGEYALGRGKSVLVPVGKTTPVDIFIWRWWSPSPGFGWLTEAHWPELERYAHAVVSGFSNNPQILAWEVMNEPGVVMDRPAEMSPAQVEARLMKFLAHFCPFVKARSSGKPITIGTEGNMDRVQNTEPYVDVISLHCYSPAPALTKYLEDTRRFAQEKGKPVMLTECLANTNNWLIIYGEERLSTDAGQLEHYRQILPILVESRLGWYSWGFITGNVFGAFVDIINPSGYRRPAAMYLEQILKGEARTAH